MAKNIFNSVKFPKVATSRFDLSHDLKLSFNMGDIIPTCVTECLPGDVFNISPQNFLRFAPLVSPVMHKVQVTTHFYFVPTRLLWPDWEKWITGDSDVEAPYFLLGNNEAELITIGSLCDYLGFPTGTYENTIPLKVSPLPIAAYWKIWNEYYRDQNLQTEVPASCTAGNNGSFQAWTQSRPARRAWMHDYFTSALPFAQKGDAVQLPLTENLDAPVVLDNSLGQQSFVRTADGAVATGDVAGQAVDGALTTGAFDTLSNLDPNGSLVVDIQADAVDINTVRRAFRLQEWLEKNARGGTRYVENILAHFGVKSSDARLQRPEYLGGTKHNMVISEVLSTAETEVPVGNMAGHGISVGGGNSFKYRCEEHGYIVGVINVQPDTAYLQGLHRKFTRFDRLDYAWPTFANIGEQEVLNKEVYATGPSGHNPNPDEIFGYIPRYAEYKFENSRVAGEMRDSLSHWHLARIFSTPPALNEEFIQADPSLRIFAVTDPDVDHIYAHIFNRISAVRKLPRYGTPTI